jgi:PAS domain S-box-containing protein
MPLPALRMPGSLPAAAVRGGLRVRVFATLAFVFALVVAVGLAALWYRHEMLINEGQQRADNLALILGEHFRRSVDAIDATLAQLALHSQRVGGPAAPSDAWAPVLAAARAALPGIGSLSVTDAAGTITASSIPQLVGESRGDFFLFQQLLGDPQSGLVADTPFRSIRDDHMFIPLGRRVTSADGAFVGIVIATLEPDGLRGFYRSVNVGPNGIIQVLHPTGLVLLQEPSQGELIGRSVGDTALLRAQREKPEQGMIRGPFEAGGPPYITAYRTLAAPPVIIAVSLAEGDILAPWRNAGLILGFILGGLGWALLWSAIFLGREIRARAVVDQHLVEANATLYAVVDTALDGFVQMDEAGIMVDWNQQAQAMFGWTREEAVGKVLADLIAPERYRGRHREGLARFLATGNSDILGKRIEIEAMRKDRREVKVELAVTALRRGSGFVFNGFIRDLTEKIAAEQQVRQLQKMDAVGRLTGGVAHDFNNMLTVIMGTIGMLEEGVADRPALAAMARLIDEAAQRGADLTGHLLAFARKQPLRPRPTDVGALIVNAERLLRPALGERVEIVVVPAGDLWRALVDATQLTTTLLNLAINARDAMPGGGKLTIETANVLLDEAYAKANLEVAAGAYVMIAVSDTGTGIPASVIERIFEPFFTTKEVGRGTGLGLSMVYGFVKQSNGHVKVYSEEGHGTTVRIYLPRAVEEPEETAAPSADADIVRGNETILVVGDDPRVREKQRAQLDGLGYTVKTAVDAAEALALVRAGAAFDLLFTDVMLPGGMSGRELADAIVKLRPALRVLYTSGYSENAIVHHGRLDPGVLLLVKPYRKADLARIIRVALDGDDRAARSKAAERPRSPSDVASLRR